MSALSDQLGRKLVFTEKPERIVCLVPSLTELLCDLGLAYKLVGITKFCVHPEELQNETALIGGTKKPEIDHIAALKPDFILANKEENTQAAIEALAKIAPVYVSDIANFEDLERCLSDLGEICGVQSSAAGLLARLKLTSAILSAEFSENRPIKALYLIWKKPYMAAGWDTYISGVMDGIKLENVLKSNGEAGKRYPKLEVAEIQELKPEIILLSSEPYRFTSTDRQELEELTGIKCIEVDGEAFSWYGSRILYCAPYISQLGQQVHGTDR